MEELNFLAAEIQEGYMLDAQAGERVLNEFMWNAQKFFRDPDDELVNQPEPSDALTSIEDYSDVHELVGEAAEKMASVYPEISGGVPSMKVYVTAYYKEDGKHEGEFYLPRERDLVMTLIYSPQSYWESKKVIFPSPDDTKESFYVKKKDPEHLGDIVLNSAVNNVAISIEKVGEEIRTDALRKRVQRSKNDPNAEQPPKPTREKRRLIKNEEIKSETDAAAVTKASIDRHYSLRVSIGELSFSRSFEIRTARDLNKYRYLRKCVELYEVK